MPTALLDSVPDASEAVTPGNTISYLFYVAALLGGAATNIAVGMNTTLGKALTEHRMLAALTMQGVGLPALFLVALVGGAFSARPPPTRCRVALVGRCSTTWACSALSNATPPCRGSAAAPC